jgi:hypothetical protein
MDGTVSAPTATPNLATPAAAALAIVRAMCGQDGYSFDADTDPAHMTVGLPGGGSITADLTRDADALPIVKVA